jgi:hydroxypyruvate reductase 1
MKAIFYNTLNFLEKEGDTLDAPRFSSGNAIHLWNPWGLRTLKEDCSVNDKEWAAHNPKGTKRVIVTKELPGDRWLEILARADCRVEVCTSADILTVEEIRTAIGDRCDGCIGQLTEPWGGELFHALKAAGGIAYSNYAVGYNNVDVESATGHGIPVGNTPGVLTETTAEMAVALTFAAARRVVESDVFMRTGRYKGWLPNLFLGERLGRKTVGVIGAGRIGTAFARMMAEGHKMNVVYYDPRPNPGLENQIAACSVFLESLGEEAISCRRAETPEELLQEADVVSLHTTLDETTHHLINAERLGLMKENAILVNTCRGQVIDEAALVAHCREHPNFRAGPRGPLPGASELPGRPRCVRRRTGHEAGPSSARQCGHRAPHRLGDGVDQGGNGHPGCPQCGRHPDGIPGVAGSGRLAVSGG